MIDRTYSHKPERTAPHAQTKMDQVLRGHHHSCEHESSVVLSHVLLSEARLSLVLDIDGIPPTDLNEPHVCVDHSIPSPRFRVLITCLVDILNAKLDDVHPCPMP